jgi:hypothetical protein
LRQILLVDRIKWRTDWGLPFSGFWSPTVYNKEHLFEPNKLNRLPGVEDFTTDLQTVAIGEMGVGHCVRGESKTDNRRTRRHLPCVTTQK